MSNHTQQNIAARISFVVSFFVLALKVYAYYQTRSTAVLSDAVETIVNVITATVALIILKYALEPADENHPYGHGKLEYFSAAFEGGIILFAAIAIIVESIRSFIAGGEVRNISEGVGYMVAATIINLVVGLYLINVGKKQKSETLRASGAHLLSDVKTTVGVAIGLFLYKVTGLLWLDPMVGLLVGLWLGYEAVDIMKRNIGGLLDETDFTSLKELSASVNKYRAAGIIDIHNLRVIRSGSFHHIDAHMVVPQFWDIKTIHDFSHEFEQEVIRDYKYQAEFAFHTDPCYQKYCQVCSIENCPVRVQGFANQRELTAEHMIKGPQHTN